MVAGTAAALVPKLRGVPAATSVRLAVTGHALAGRQLAAAARRAWWPLVAAATISRRGRRLAALAAASGLVDGGPRRLLDDAAYGLGVWRGVLTEHEVGPLMPELRGWPGKRR